MKIHYQKLHKQMKNIIVREEIVKDKKGDPTDGHQPEPDLGDVDLIEADKDNEGDGQESGMND